MIAIFNYVYFVQYDGYKFLAFLIKPYPYQCLHLKADPFILVYRCCDSIITIIRGKLTETLPKYECPIQIQRT